MATKEDGRWKPAKPAYPQRPEVSAPKDTELVSGVSRKLHELLLQYTGKSEVYPKLIILSQSLLTDPTIGHKQIVFNNPLKYRSGAQQLIRGHVPEINEEGDLRFVPDRGNYFSKAEPTVGILEQPQNLPTSEWSFSDLKTFLDNLGLTTDLTNIEWSARNTSLKEALILKKVGQFSQETKRVESLSDDQISQLVEAARPKSRKITHTDVGLRITETNKKTGEVIETFTVNIIKKELRYPFYPELEWQIEVVCGGGQATRYDWGQNIDWTQTVLVRKPVIYLYPTQPTQVSVNLEFTKGPVIVEYPKRENGSWVVNAQPDGKLLVGDKEYPYLFWEAKPTTPYQFDQAEGFCLGKDEFVPFFEEKLKLLGLNDKEIADFITYWYPLMASNPFTYVNFLGQEYLDSARLNVSPAPESTIRVFVLFKSMIEKVNLKPQELVRTPRNGFTLVEWGGSNLDDK